MLAAIAIIMASLSLSCGSKSTSTAPNHIAYVTLPNNGSVLLLQIDGATGAIVPGAQTPNQNGFTPTALALAPSRKFLYAINSYNYTISIFNVANDGTLSSNINPVPAGSGPTAAIVDPFGGYLLVTNVFSNDISVYKINSSGALSELTASGSPFPANEGPTQITFTHSGKFVYVTNPVLGMVTGFSFANGVLTQLPGSPTLSGAGAAALVVDGSDRFLYVANPSASNAAPYEYTTGNISGFEIADGTNPSYPTPGELIPIEGSPFVSTAGTEGPTMITIDPTGSLIYAITSGSSDSIWCFSLNAENTQYGQLVEVTGSPFSVAAGGLFALFDPNSDYFYIGSESAKGIEGYSYDSSTGVLKALSGSPYSTAGVAPGEMVFSE
jgi:6-phosphogluconolactonase (cycloisomerase 2 family)